MSNPAIIAAAVSALVALIGTLVQLRQLRSKVQELEEQNRQTQLLEILKKRMECYPSLWQAVISKTINWVYESDTRNSQWADAFLKDLDDWNASHGLFLSHAASLKFIEMRSFLVQIVGKLSDDETVTNSDYKKLYYIFQGNQETGERGLSTYLKNDLGSYRIAAIQSSKTSRKE